MYASRRPLNHLWWLHPVPLFAATVVLTLVVAVFTSQRGYALFATPKYLETWHLAVGLGAWGALGMGYLLATRTGALPRPASASTADLIRPWFYGAFALTMTGYAIWLLVGLKNGFSLSVVWQLLAAADRTAADTIKEEIFPTIPGLTTASQFGIAAMLLGTWLVCRGERPARWLLGILLTVSVARALLYSERLALMELLLPAAALVIRSLVLGRNLPHLGRSLMQALPIIGAAVVLVLFGTFEYFRSWQYYQDEFDHIGQFTVWRLFGYYTTAHNNGAMTMELMGPWPLPYESLTWLWNFPLVESSSLSYESLTGVAPMDAYKRMLELHANEELNNDGGLFAPARDFGWIGFGVYWFAFGFLTGKCYRGLMAGSLAGAMLYPLFFLAILETPRLQYLTATRTFPSLVLLGAMFCWIWLQRTSNAAANCPSLRASA